MGRPTSKSQHFCWEANYCYLTIKNMVIVSCTFNRYATFCDHRRRERKFSTLNSTSQLWGENLHTYILRLGQCPQMPGAKGQCLVCLQWMIRHWYLVCYVQQLQTSWCRASFSWLSLCYMHLTSFIFVTSIHTAQYFRVHYRDIILKFSIYRV